jgi:hypothetical protein
VAEMVIKWYYLGLKNYFTSAWNNLDAFIVFTSLLNFALTCKRSQLTPQLCPNV